MPGGCTHARMRRSCRYVAVRLPRFALTAWWIGREHLQRTNTTPMSASGPREVVAVLDGADDDAHRDRRRRRAARRAAAGSPTTSRRVRGAARGSTAKNFHSFRARESCDHGVDAIGSWWDGPARTSSGVLRDLRRRTRDSRADGWARRSSRRAPSARAKCASRSSTNTHGTWVSRCGRRRRSDAFATEQDQRAVADVELDPARVLLGLGEQGRVEPERVGEPAGRGDRRAVVDREVQAREITRRPRGACRGERTT